MLQPPRGLFCADILSTVCKARGPATAAELRPEQGCAHPAQPVCQKQGHGSVLGRIWAPEGSASTVPTQQQ